MGAVAYVNGRYCALGYDNGRGRALGQAAVNVEDRGFQFGDGIYEVVYVQDGRLIDAPLHMARLQRSLREIDIPVPLSAAALEVVMREVLRRNRISTGLVYLQISRGVARRDHAFPATPLRPSLIVTARHRPAPPRDAAAWAGSAITLPDERWARCDIKSTNLLPNVLAKQKARQAGAYEAILYDAAQTITEGASSSVWMVDGNGALLTRKLGHEILPGCTRAALLEELRTTNIAVSEAPFTLAELRRAREIFVTSATSFVKPIIRLDGAPVGDGVPGPVTTSLFQCYSRHMQDA
jgi:D-alanine transaminase